MIKIQSLTIVNHLNLSKDPLSRNKKLSSAMVAKLFVHQLARVASYKIHIDPPCTIAS